MDVEMLTSRAISGMFYRELAAEREKSWVPQIASVYSSDQPAETYPFLSAVPAMREWIAGRQAKGFGENKITITNKHFETTIEFKVPELRRDKFGQVRVRIGEMAERAASHPRKLLTTLLNNGESGICYDGGPFFGAHAIWPAHSTAGSDTQSNLLELPEMATIMPLGFTGTPTSPTSMALATGIGMAIEHLQGFRDDAGEPIHGADSMRFHVLVPATFGVAAAGWWAPQFAADIPNPLTGHMKKHTIEVIKTVRLAYTDAFVVLRTDNPNARALIYQQETELMLKSKDVDSEFAFDTDMVQYGVDQWSNAAYGFPTYACLVRFT
jgi:phage major head subunit gpT-like protein